MGNAIVIILVGGGILLILLLVRWTARAVDRKQESLFNEKTSPSAEVRSLCYLRECFMEEPGVAQVLDGKLSINTVTGKSMVIPLPQVKLVKVDYNIGRYPWWGLTCFVLETPKSSGLVLGVKDPQPWFSILGPDAQA
jgi:hypothetical protein